MGEGFHIGHFERALERQQFGATKLGQLRDAHLALSGVLLTVIVRRVELPPRHESPRHVYEGAARGARRAQVVLELAGMKAHVGLIGIDIALPVDDHLGAVDFIGNGVDASGECLWAASIRDKPVDWPLGNEPCTQGGDLGQLQGAPGSGGDLLGIRKRVAIRGVEDEFAEQFTDAAGELPHLLDELAGQHLLHQLVQEKPAHAPRADRRVDLRRIARLKRNRLDRRNAVGIVIARPNPSKRDGSHVDGDALGGEKQSARWADRC